MNATKLLLTCNFHLGELSGRTSVFSKLNRATVTQVHRSHRADLMSCAFYCVRSRLLQGKQFVCYLQKSFGLFLFTFNFLKDSNTCAFLFRTFSNVRNSSITWRNSGMMKAWRRALRGPTSTSWLTAPNSKWASGHSLASLKLPLHPRLCCPPRVTELSWVQGTKR